MARSARTRAEHVSGVRRRMPRQPESAFPVAPPELPRIHMSLSRAADAEADRQNSNQWHIFLDDLAARNREKGTVNALGSLILPYVTTQQFSQMLSDKYPKNFQSVRKKVQLFRSVASNINDFTREKAKAAYDSKLDKLITARAFSEADYGAHSFPSDEEMANDITSLSVEEQAQLDEYAFGPAILDVKGLELQGEGYGLDFFPKELIFEEFNAYMNFFRREEKLDTSQVMSSWRPLAATFVRHGHMPIVSVSHTEEAPVHLAFHEPKLSMIQTK